MFQFRRLTNAFILGRYMLSSGQYHYSPDLDFELVKLSNEFFSNYVDPYNEKMTEFVPCSVTLE